jgi:hypothetical protein
MNQIRKKKKDNNSTSTTMNWIHLMANNSGMMVHIQASHEMGHEKGVTRNKSHVEDILQKAKRNAILF